MLDNFDTNLRSVTRDFNAAVLGGAYDPPVAGELVTLQPAQVQAVSGAYKMDDGDTMCVSQGKQFLEAAIKARFTAGLLPLSAGRFYMPFSSGLVTFAGGASAPGMIGLR